MGSGGGGAAEQHVGAEVSAFAPSPPRQSRGSTWALCSQTMTERISKLLGLPATGQDWGTENSDPARLAEFIAKQTGSGFAKPYNGFSSGSLALGA